MAKSSRASVVKKNNQRLKKHVFGPVESARNERLNAKLLELASQPKPPRSEMEIEQDEAKDGPEAKGDQADVDVDMDADESAQATARRNSASKKNKPGKNVRIEKKRHRKPKNKIAFPTHPKKAKRR